VPDGLILSTCENSGAANSTSTASGATSVAAAADGTGSSSAVAGDREQQGQASCSSMDASASLAAVDEVRLLCGAVFLLKVVHATPTSVLLCACGRRQGLCYAQPVWFWHFYVLAAGTHQAEVFLRSCCRNPSG
jgi:hypothetical protein